MPPVREDGGDGAERSDDEQCGGVPSDDLVSRQLRGAVVEQSGRERTQERRDGHSCA